MPLQRRSQEERARSTKGLGSQSAQTGHVEDVTYMQSIGCIARAGGGECGQKYCPRTNIVSPLNPSPLPHPLIGIEPWDFLVFGSLGHAGSQVSFPWLWSPAWQWKLCLAIGRWGLSVQGARAPLPLFSRGSIAMGLGLLDEA